VNIIIIPSPGSEDRNVSGERPLSVLNIDVSNDVLEEAIVESCTRTTTQNRNFIEIPEDEPSASGTQIPEDEPSTSGTQIPEDEPSTSGTQIPEDEPSTSGTQIPGDEPSTSGTQIPEDEPSTSGTQIPEDEPSTSGTRIHVTNTDSSDITESSCDGT